MGQSGKADCRGVPPETLLSGLPTHTEGVRDLVPGVLTAQFGNELMLRQVDLAGGGHHAAQRRQPILTSGVARGFRHRVNAVQVHRHGYSVPPLSRTVPSSRNLACRAKWVNGVPNPYELVRLVGNLLRGLRVNGAAHSQGARA